jgi:tRNA (guanine-N7-)-methyltransferase
MFANSRQVHSNQVSPHPRLADFVARHLRSPHLRAPSAAGRAAFASVVERLAQAPFILDAGCGTGASTFAIARAMPQFCVLGLDKSIARLQVSQREGDAGLAPANAILLHCE